MCTDDPIITLEESSYFVTLIPSTGEVNEEYGTPVCLSVMCLPYCTREGLSTLVGMQGVEPRTVPYQRTVITVSPHTRCPPRTRTWKSLSQSQVGLPIPLVSIVLSHEDSNPNLEDQNLLCCRYTMGEGWPPGESNPELRYFTPARFQLRQGAIACRVVRVSGCHHERTTTAVSACHCRAPI